MSKYTLNKLYKVTFYDHCLGQKELAKCKLVGWLIKEDKLSITLTFWLVDSKDKTVVAENLEPVTIAKSTILSTRKYS